MSTASEAGASAGIPAATVVVFRNGAEGGPPEVLMVTRARSMAFAGGAAVFPGGRVDEADRQLAEAIGAEEPDEAAHRIAAIRETLEETGLAIGMRGAVDAARAGEARKLLLETQELAPVLEAMDWSLDLDAVVPFARWFPQNEKLSRVFDTRFYLADLGTGAVDIAVDATENTKLFWTTAKDALAKADAGEIAIIFPTRRNLERLAQFDSFAEAASESAEIAVQTIVPFMEERDGETWICIPEDRGYPVTAQRLATMRRG